MKIIAGILAVYVIVIVLVDAFETIVLPRRVTRQMRLAKLFYHLTWMPWRWLARKVRAGNPRESLLSYYGPLSMLMLLAVWALGIVMGFGVLQWAVGSHINPNGGLPNLGNDLYLSGSSFFTLGLGDVTPNSTLSRWLIVIESGLGLGFLGLIISYLPALTGAFSRREVYVSLLDAQAGSPPTAYQLLRRYISKDQGAPVSQFLLDWERWSAELMESHLSYPVLAYFRSQHENQSWVTALAMILDVSALVIVGVDDEPTEPARRAFAVARHACVDLTQVFDTPPIPLPADRLPPTDLTQLRVALLKEGIILRTGPEADAKLTKLRASYEPYINALSQHLVVPLPPWLPDPEKKDNWQTTAWDG